MNKKGLLIVLSGPSGAGKGTVLKELLKSNHDVKVSVSATTRPPREGEVHGREYFFIEKDEFLEKVANGDMLEHNEYCGNYYGTPRDAVENWLNKGTDVILEIEVNGAHQVMSSHKDAVGIFIVPPSFEELSARLVNRNTNDESDIANRLKTAVEEVKRAIDYDYIVVNDKIEDCAAHVYDIIRAEKFRTKRNLTIREVLLNA